MNVLGVEFLVEYRLTLVLCVSLLAGSTLGIVSGLIPGLHANNFAFLLAAVAVGVPAPPLAVGTAMLAAGVVHSFVNAIPMLALGVPDAEMAPTALPGHRLVMNGRGREAVRLSALGSGLAVALAVPLAIPVTVGMQALYPAVHEHYRLLLIGVLAGLLLAERTRRSRLGGACTLVLSGLLGWVSLDLDPAAPLDAGGMLAPLFAGLFGAPILLDALGSGGLPEQGDATLCQPRWRVASTALAGALAGALVGYLPGISAAIAAVAVLVVLPGDLTDRGYVVATSGVDTANAIFALFALVSLGEPRTGVLVAVEEVSVPLNLPVLVSAILCAGAIGTAAVFAIGDLYLRLVASVEYLWLSAGVLCLLVVLSGLFAGLAGVGVFCLATAVGLVPTRFGSYRIHCMGVLLCPMVITG
jgi:putative membrane protein